MQRARARMFHTTLEAKCKSPEVGKTFLQNQKSSTSPRKTTKLYLSKEGKGRSPLSLTSRWKTWPLWAWLPFLMGGHIKTTTQDHASDKATVWKAWVFSPVRMASQRPWAKSLPGVTQEARLEDLGGVQQLSPQGIVRLAQPSPFLPRTKHTPRQIQAGFIKMGWKAANKRKQWQTGLQGLKLPGARGKGWHKSVLILHHQYPA